MLIKYGYNISIICQQPTPMILRLDIHADEAWRAHQINPLGISPQLSVHEFNDAFGNRARRFLAPSGQTSFFAEGIVSDDGSGDRFVPTACETPVAQLPTEVLQYLLASRYCDTDLLSPLAWQLFGNVAPGWPRAQAICNYVHQVIRFDYNHARNTRTASEAHAERVGVCRDFAHLAIAFCRCMNIPARYVNGYLGDIGVPANPAPMDFSAWFEVYLGEWYTLDARHNHPRIGRIVIARGRDAADVPMIHSFGEHQLALFEVVTHEVTPAEIASAASGPPPQSMQMQQRAA